MQFIYDLPLGTLLIIAILLGMGFWRYRSGKRQFTLRGMLIFMFLVSLPLAWFAYGAREYIREQNAIAKLREAGIDVRTDNFRRTWQSFFFGSVWQHRAFAVYADAAPVSRQVLELIGSLPCVSTIRIKQGTFADDDLASLAALPRLKELDLRQCPITGAGLRHIPAQVPMERLSLSFSPIDDAGLSHVSRWKALEHLELAGTQITDLGLDSLASLENLDRLVLDHTAVTDAGIRRQAGLIANVSTLSLQNTEVTQATLDGLHKGMFSPPAPSTAHRRAVTKLLLLGIDVHVWDAEEGHARCSIAIAKGWKEHPETADLLRQLCPIQSVTLRSPQAIDSVVPLLADLNSLHGIRIEGPALSSQGLLEFSKQSHPDLQKIELEKCQFSPQAIRGLAAFPSLRHLFLSQALVDSAAIPQFSGFRQLTYLTFHDSRVSDDVAFKLQMLLPFTVIQYGTKECHFSAGDTNVHLDDLGTPVQEQVAMRALRDQGMAFERPNLAGQFRHCWGSVKDVQAAVPQLCKLSALESLAIYAGKFEPESLERLNSLKQLRVIAVRTDDLNGLNLNWLRDLPHLQMLTLQGGNFDDAASLADLVNLERLEINSSGFSDAHLASLAHLTRLRSLNLRGTAVTDASIVGLAARTELIQLDLSYTRLTQAGVDQLRVDLPRLRVVAEGLPQAANQR